MYGIPFKPLWWLACYGAIALALSPQATGWKLLELFLGALAMWVWKKYAPHSRNEPPF